MRVFPNPATGFITVDYCLPNEETKGSIKLFDLTGKAYATKLLSANTNQLVISLKGLPLGIYLMELSDLNGQVEVIKLTIQ